MKISFIPLFVTLLLALASLSAAGQSPEPVDFDKEVKAATLHRVGDTAPDFTCRATDGKPFTLSAHKGKVVLLYFFGEIPGACVIEMSYIEKAIAKKLGNRDDLVILAIGYRMEREQVVNLAGQNKITLALAADPQGDIFKRYYMKYVPRAVVVRKNGSIAFQRSGYKESDGVMELLEVVSRELRLPGS